MRYNDVATFVTDGYVALGYDPHDMAGTFPVIDPGPPTDVALDKLSSNRIVFLTFGGGAGLTSEDVFDRPFISARVVGNQNDYADAENLAWQLDTMLLALNDKPTRMIGTARVLYVVRSGGAPVLLEKDSAARYHFTCTYITETASKL